MTGQKPQPRKRPSSTRALLGAFGIALAVSVALTAILLQPAWSRPNARAVLDPRPTLLDIAPAAPSATRR